MRETPTCSQCGASDAVEPSRNVLWRWRCARCQRMFNASAPAVPSEPTSEHIDILANLLVYLMGEGLQPTQKHRGIARDLLRRGVDVSRAGFLTVRLAGTDGDATPRED
jgi:transposase-like protein